MCYIYRVVKLHGWQDYISNSKHFPTEYSTRFFLKEHIANLSHANIISYTVSPGRFQIPV